MNLPGEAEAVKTVLSLCERYGYGNMIAHIRKQWAEMLIKEWNLAENAALDATIVDAYPLEIK